MTEVSGQGWSRFSIWEHSQHIRELYESRAAGREEEMTCAAQAAELLATLAEPGDSVLDVGCGSGWFFHSLRARGLDVDYWGIDASTPLVAIGQRLLPEFGLSADRLSTIRIEDLDGEADHVVCMNVLSNIDNYHRPLERLLTVARKSVILRESFGDGNDYRWVTDAFLDPGVDLRVHVNRYDLAEVMAFVESLGFDARHVVDRRTGGEPEFVIGHPHHWAFLVACRRT